MPCWEVKTMSVEFQTKHRGLLEKALAALGYDWTEKSQGVLDVMQLGVLDLNNNKASVYQKDQSRLNQLKQQYSKEALRRAAKLQGWQMKTKGQKGVLRR